MQKTDPAVFEPTPEQYSALADRIAPVIKSFFAAGQIQKEFAEWQERQNPVE